MIELKWERKWNQLLTVIIIVVYWCMHGMYVSRDTRIYMWEPYTYWGQSIYFLNYSPSSSESSSSSSGCATSSTVRKGDKVSIFVSTTNAQKTCEANWEKSSALTINLFFHFLLFFLLLTSSDVGLLFLIRHVWLLLKTWGRGIVILGYRYPCVQWLAAVCLWVRRSSWDSC